MKSNDPKYVMAKSGKLMIAILPDKCDFCGCCVGVCPEDAIELKEAAISIIAPLCTNCSKCIWSCPIEVLKFNKEGILLQAASTNGAGNSSKISDGMHL